MSLEMKPIEMDEMVEMMDEMVEIMDEMMVEISTI